MNSNDACIESRQNPSFLGAYKQRLVLCLGAGFIACGALGLPASHFLIMLERGALQYLALAIPLALFMVVFFILFDAHVPKPTLGLRHDAPTWILLGLGATMIAWGLSSPLTFWGRTGFAVICWGGDLRCMREECAYWKAWKQRRKNRK
jgi:hypothetical protein